MIGALLLALAILSSLPMVAPPTTNHSISAAQSLFDSLWDIFSFIRHSSLSFPSNPCASFSNYQPPYSTSMPLPNNVNQMCSSVAHLNPSPLLSLACQTHIILSLVYPTPFLSMLSSILHKVGAYRTS